MDGEKLQRNDKNKPVVWKILADHELTARIEKYALARSICEADVWRKGVKFFLDSVKAPKTGSERTNAARLAKRGQARTHGK